MSRKTAFEDAASAVAFLVAAGSLFFLGFIHHLFAMSPVLVAVQVGALLLMVWARLTFGRRSFHATASSTEGALVTNGPYRYWRHPIYASIVYFLWTGQFRSPTLFSLVAAALATVSLLVRMLLEERLLRDAYPEYPRYAKRSKRFIPFLL